VRRFAGVRRLVPTQRPLLPHVRSVVVERNACVSLFHSLSLATGALFTLTVDEQIFNKNSLDRLVASMAGPAVSTYSFRTDRNILQLTVTDNSTNELSLRLAAQIFDYLKG